MIDALPWNDAARRIMDDPDAQRYGGITIPPEAKIVADIGACCWLHAAMRDPRFYRGRGRRPRHMDRVDWWAFPRDVRRRMLSGRCP